MKVPDLGPEKWRDLPQNPLIAPPEGTSVVGDPQVILPGELDELWHMFITGEGRESRDRGEETPGRASNRHDAKSAKRTA